MAAANVYSQYPPDLGEEEQQLLITSIQDWSIAHGLAVRPPPSFVTDSQDPNVSLAVTAPVTLFPSPFPRKAFADALSIQPAYNELYARIASDEAWLDPIVGELLGVDSFMADLWKVHQRVKADGYAQDLSLGLFRSDYMVHVDADSQRGPAAVRQVEFNTIASSFGGLSSRVSAMHRALSLAQAYPTHVASYIDTNNIQVSESARRLAQGLATAHSAYEQQSTPSGPSCVLFIVQSPERNVFDQRHLEYHLQTDHNVPSFRLPLEHVLSYTSLDSDRNLVYSPPHLKQTSFQVSVLYFRAGYSPTDHDFSDAWDARYHLERSRAIKCPSILTQLSGAKKVQQVLATPASPHLSHFITNESVAAQLKNTFAPIYPLDTSPAGQEARSLALDPSTATNYVLKPQREGGGNNIYRSKIPGFLKNLPESQWPAYILMEMINPPPQRNAILRNGQVQKGGVISELGVYGTVLWRSNIDDNGSHTGVKQIIFNEQAGYLLRTKGDTSEEGGVAAGFGSVDSVLLVDV